jgi:2-methylcitrate dehydratase PrpD
VEPGIERLGRFVAELAYDLIPAEARRAARFQVLDMIAAVHAAARGREVQPVRDAVGAFAGEGRATCLATGSRHGPGDAALANAAFSMAEDYDDIVWMGHTCHSAVFASLAVAEHEGKDGRDLVTAIVAANEVGGRLGASCILGPLNGQMWTFIHLASAAAATARLLSLDAGRATHALSIALAQPNFALQPGFLVPSSKLLAASTPTQAGIQAAYFARAGMTGHPRILEDRRGFWARFSFLPLPVMLGGLGETWVTETLAFKTYPGCHYFQTALTAIDRVRARWPALRADDVRRMRIDTTQLACEATRFASEYVAESGMSPVSVNFDLARSAALLLHAGKLSPVELDRDYLARNEEALVRIARRIEVRHDPALTARVVDSARALGAGRAALRSIRLLDGVRLARRYRAEYRSRLASASEATRLVREVVALARRRPAEARTEGSAVPLAFPSRVTIEGADGRREVEQVDVPVGSFYAGDAQAHLEAKFVRETSPSLGEDDARSAFRAGLHVEDERLSELVARVCVR